MCVRMKRRPCGHWNSPCSRGSEAGLPDGGVCSRAFRVNMELLEGKQGNLEKQRDIGLEGKRPILCQRMKFCGGKSGGQ